MARLHGTITRSDGSKVNGTARISTSWNDNTGSSSNGKYTLDLGGNPKQKITIYVDGKVAKTVYVDGDTNCALKA